MESDCLEKIIEKSEEESIRQEQMEEEKSNKEQDKISDINKKSEENIHDEEISLKLDPYLPSKYILKYKRTEEQLKEIAFETEMPKTESCQFMLNLNIIKGENSNNLLVVNFHEIAAIYFDEIYERKYTLEELCHEIIFFKVFDTIEEARNIIDETMKKNEKNRKKIFIGFDNKTLQFHMKLTFFDKEKEIIFNIPKKILSPEEKDNMMPFFLTEIHQKMNELKEENKKLKSFLKNESERELIGSDDEKNIDFNESEIKTSGSKGQKKKIIKKKKVVKSNTKEQKNNSNSENFI